MCACARMYVTPVNASKHNLYIPLVEASTLRSASSGPGSPRAQRFDHKRGDLFTTPLRANSRAFGLRRIRLKGLTTFGLGIRVQGVLPS